MSLDLFFRAKSSAIYTTWLTTSQVQAIIGDLRARDAEGNVITPTSLQGIQDNVYIKEFSENQIMEVPAVRDAEGNKLTPAVMDPWAWVHIRLTGNAEISDFAGPPGENDFDRWEHSKLVSFMNAAGRSATHRGVSIFEITTGKAKGISIVRGYEMNAMGIKIHEILGGNAY